MRRLLYPPLHLFLCAALLAILLPTATPAPLEAAPQAQATTPTPAPPVTNLTFAPLDETLSRINRVKRVVSRIQRALDRSQTDISALAFALDGDAEAIVDWVRAEIAFEQYPGLLRGARGALLSRAGNALDTALLLAALLTDGGYDVRIARGELDTVQARDLVDQMLVPRPTAISPTNTDRMEVLLRELGAALGLSNAEADAILKETLAEADAVHPRIEDAQTDADFILDSLAAAGIVPGDDAAVANLVSEAADYFWVEYRLGPGRPWQEVHPAFKDPAAAPADLEILETFGEEAPADLYHRIRIKVEIEQLVDEELVTHVIMPPWEARTADLVGQTLIYRNALLGLSDLDDLTDLARMLDEEPIFLPSFNNQLLVNGQGFDLNGVTYNPSQANNGLFRLAQSVGGALAEAMSLFDTLDTDEAADSLAAAGRIALAGQWIDYTLIAPGGRERTVRRAILDRIGAENRAEGVVAIAEGEEFPAAAAPLLTQYNIMVMPAPYNRAYAAERYMAQLAQQLDLLDYLRKQLPFGDEPISPPINLLTASKPFDDVVLNMLLASYPPATPEQRAYRAEPYLVVLEDGVRLDEDGLKGVLRVDVVNNGRRSFVVDNGALRQDATANILAGAWETHAEGSPFAAIPGKRFSTMVAFASAAQMDAAVRIITPDDPSPLDDLDIPAASKTAMAMDLAGGYLVIVPEPLGRDGQAGWWRVHPQTGETLGLAEDGRGDAIVEYSFLTELRLNLILGAPSTFAGFTICMGGASGGAGCCTADALVTWGGGAALGAAIAYKSAVIAILVGELLKVGGLMGGATGTAPSFCNL